MLKPTDELSPSPPLAYDSPEKAAEIQEVASYTRTWQTNQKALYYQTFEGVLGGCASGAFTAMLAQLFPADADAIIAKGEEAASLRLWGGILFSSDIKVGLEPGRAVAQKVIEHDQQGMAH